MAAPTAATSEPPDGVDWMPLIAWDQMQPLPAAARRGPSTWQAVRWSALPGVHSDAPEDVWSALLNSCQRPPAPLQALCAQAPGLADASQAQRLHWLVTNWQPYQVLGSGGQTQGLLTGYFEPVLQATRLPDAQHQIALYATPRQWRANDPWYSREQVDRDPAAQAALAGRALVYLNDPLDALLLQIQGSGRVRVREADGQQRSVRLAFAGHNGHPYQSVARWLIERGEVRVGTWEAIRAWAAQNPTRVQAMLWSNPRLVFFREEGLDELLSSQGPRGAQGVALTPMRSIAVDKTSILYGTPVWLVTDGPSLRTQRWVMAQDTGGAIKGALRADFFTGWGEAAHELAAGLKQPVSLWVLWPRGARPGE